MPKARWISSHRTRKIIAKSLNNVLFSSDNLFDDPRPNFKNLSLAAFDTYAFISYCFLKAYIQHGKGVWDPEYLDVSYEANRIEKSFKIELVNIKTSPYELEQFLENKNLVRPETIMSWINYKFGLTDTIMKNWHSSVDIQPYCHEILYSATRANIYQNFIFDFPVEARKYVADWAKDLGYFYEWEYDDYINTNLRSDNKRVLGSVDCKTFSNRLHIE